MAASARGSNRCWIRCTVPVTCEAPSSNGCVAVRRFDGFGHPLYRAGDPRATELLDQLRDRYPRSAELRFLMQAAAAATGATGEKPNVDFALAALARVLRLPPGSALTIFAIGRTIGWIGQAIEQYANGQLIRPRAKYVGATPSERG